MFFKLRRYFATVSAFTAGIFPAACLRAWDSSSCNASLAKDQDLFDILRKKRKEIADQANLPPFTIFHDRTLKEMALRSEEYGLKVGISFRSISPSFGGKCP